MAAIFPKIVLLNSSVISASGARPEANTFPQFIYFLNISYIPFQSKQKVGASSPKKKLKLKQHGAAAPAILSAPSLLVGTKNGFSWCSMSKECAVSSKTRL